MVPTFFGPAGGRLFGIHHPPLAAARGEGVVICQPWGHEYIRAHRTLRQLAEHLAEQGFPVLRFDYSGCGDSAGEEGESSVERWVADTHAAIDELKDTARVETVTLVGLRLGATMAARAAAARADVRRLILWNPVTSGRDYLSHLARLQRRWLKGRPGSRLFAFAPRPSELIGFEMPPALRREIERIDLSTRMTGSTSTYVLPVAGDWDDVEQVHNGLNVPGVAQQVSSIALGAAS